MKRYGKGTGEDPVTHEIDDEGEIQDALQYPVRPIAQELKWSCGPTALLTAIRYQFGLNLTQNEMILLCGATESGTDEYNFGKALDILGFKYKQSNSGTLNKLKKVLGDGQLPIVHMILNDGCGHYMCLCGYDEENVWLSDPANGKIVKFGIPYFLGVWKVEEKETQTRWYMAVTGKTTHSIDSLVNKLKKIKRKIEKLQ